MARRVAKELVTLEEKQGVLGLLFMIKQSRLHDKSKLN